MDSPAPPSVVYCQPASVSISILWLPSDLWSLCAAYKLNWFTSAKCVWICFIFHWTVLRGRVLMGHHEEVIRSSVWVDMKCVFQSTVFYSPRDWLYHLSHKWRCKYVWGPEQDRGRIKMAYFRAQSLRGKNAVVITLGCLRQQRNTASPHWLVLLLMKPGVDMAFNKETHTPI